VVRVTGRSSHGRRVVITRHVAVCAAS